MRKSVKKSLMVASLTHFLLWCFLGSAILIVFIFVEPPKDLHEEDLKAWTIGFDLMIRYFAVLAGAGLVSSLLLFLSFRGIFRSGCKRLDIAALCCSGLSALIVYLVGIICFIEKSFGSVLLFSLVATAFWVILSLSGGVLLGVSARKRKAYKRDEKDRGLSGVYV